MFKIGKYVHRDKDDDNGSIGCRVSAMFGSNMFMQAEIDCGVLSGDAVSVKVSQHMKRVHL